MRVRVIQLQRLLKALLQALEEEQRTAEEQHIALDLTALRQTRDGLVDDRLKDGRGNVLLARALVEQRLDVRLGEHAAAGRDGVNALRALCQFIELGRVTSSRTAIWSMNAPVPPAQEPFMRSSS